MTVKPRSSYAQVLSPALGLCNDATVDLNSSTLAQRRSAAEKKDRARYGEKRDRIIAAAGPVLEQLGLQGATVGAIAKEAGLDRATVYYYFPDKFAIFRAAIHLGLEEMFESLDAIANETTPFEARLRDAIRAVMDVFERHYPYLYIYFREGATSEVIDKNINAETLHSGVRYEEVLLGIIQGGIDSGEFVKILPAKVTVNLIVGMLNWTYAWFRPDGPLSGRDIADGMTETLLAPMLARPKRSPRATKRPSRRGSS
jgi:TetR/AcrR family transcriptional regulator, cholesterol catabolism regulator